MAAGSTYEPIATSTVSGTTTNTVTFSSIPSTYTDLVLIDNGKLDTSDNSYFMTFNGDTATNYSTTYIIGSGTAASSGRAATQARILISRATNSNFSSGKTFINNYKNTTAYKTTLCIGGSSTSYVITTVGLWKSTAAITSLSLSSGAQYFVAGTTFTLYGIAAA